MQTEIETDSVQPKDLEETGGIKNPEDVSAIEEIVVEEMAIDGICGVY